jgi:hypothetical protein
MTCSITEFHANHAKESQSFLVVSCLQSISVVLFHTMAQQFLEAFTELRVY